MDKLNNFVQRKMSHERITPSVEYLVASIKLYFHVSIYLQVTATTRRMVLATLVTEVVQCLTKTKEVKMMMTSLTIRQIFIYLLALYH